MHRAVIIKVFVGFMWMKYQTTSILESVRFYEWMTEHGHTVSFDDQFVDVDREIPSIERIEPQLL